MSVLGSACKWERDALSAGEWCASDGVRADLREAARRRYHEVATGRIPHDTQKRSNKADPVWINSCWVGRKEAPDDHVLLMEKGMLGTKSVRKAPPTHPATNTTPTTSIGR